MGSFDLLAVYVVEIQVFILFLFLSRWVCDVFIVGFEAKVILYMVLAFLLIGSIAVSGAVWWIMAVLYDRGCVCV